jgi:hypothetical protein
MENLKMIGKTKILTGLAAIAVVGSAGVPFVASAHQSGTPGATAQATAPEHGGPRGGTALATALGVTPEALKAAMEAARAATPKLTADQMKDPAAREANHAAHQAALATSLGITVEQLQAAQTSVAPASGNHKGPGGPGHGAGGPGHGPGGVRGAGNEALAKALGIDVATLTAAENAVREAMPKPAFTPGTRPDPAAMEALKAQHTAALATQLGISVDALNAAQAKVKAEFESAHQARGAEMLATVLAKAVTDGKITQAQADEIKAQVAQGGDAAKAARETLRTLLGGSDHPNRGPGGPGGRGPGGPAKAATPSA